MNKFPYTAKVTEKIQSIFAIFLSIGVICAITEAIVFIDKDYPLWYLMFAVLTFIFSIVCCCGYWKYEVNKVKIYNEKFRKAVDETVINNQELFDLIDKSFKNTKADYIKYNINRERIKNDLSDCCFTYVYHRHGYQNLTYVQMDALRKKIEEIGEKYGFEMDQNTSVYRINCDEIELYMDKNNSLKEW